MVGRVTQSLDCRLPKAQVHIDARSTPRQKSSRVKLATQIKTRRKKDLAMWRLEQGMREVS